MWSADVASRTSRGIVLTRAARRRFHDELRELQRSGDHGPRRAWAFVEARHGAISPAIQLEEEIGWLAVSQADPASDVEERLRDALASLVLEGRSGLATWANQALPRMPDVARSQPSAWYLDQASASLPGPPSPPIEPPGVHRHQPQRPPHCR